MWDVFWKVKSSSPSKTRFFIKPLFILFLQKQGSIFLRMQNVNILIISLLVNAAEYEDIGWF